MSRCTSPTGKLPSVANHPIAALDFPGFLPAPLNEMAEPTFDRFAPRGQA